MVDKVLRQAHASSAPREWTGAQLLGRYARRAGPARPKASDLSAPLPLNARLAPRFCSGIGLRAGQISLLEHRAFPLDGEDPAIAASVAPLDACLEEH